MKPETVLTDDLRAFESSVAYVARMNERYMAKAMPDDVYQQFSTERDERIPEMRSAINAKLAQRQEPVEPTQEKIRAAEIKLTDEQRKLLTVSNPVSIPNAAPATPMREPVKTAPCKGMNCGSTDGVSHSLECQGEQAAIAFRSFVPAPATPAQDPVPPFGSKRKEAMAIYTPPFKYVHGYIYDSQSHVVADDDKVEGAVASRVRGWGRIGYMPNPEQLQDEVGQMIADALNAYYTTPQPTPAQEDK